MGEWRTGRPPDRRLTVAQAADALGISEGAVRSRIKRGTLRTKRADERVYVVLGAGEPSDEPPGEPSEPLVDELRDRVHYLEGIITTRDEEIRRRDVIISQLTERIPAIEAPSEPREAPESGTDEQQGRGPIPEATSPQGGTERRSWWRRVFGG